MCVCVSFCVLPVSGLKVLLCIPAHIPFATFCHLKLEERKLSVSTISRKRKQVISTRCVLIYQRVFRIISVCSSTYPGKNSFKWKVIHFSG